MKKAEDYLEHVTAFTTREELYNIGRQMQIDAYNQAIEDSIQSVEFYKSEDDDRFDGINYESISRLIITT